MDDDDKIDDENPPEDDETGDNDPPEDDDDADQQTEAEKRLATALKKARQERNEARRKLAEARKTADKGSEGDKDDQRAADEAVSKLTGTLVRQAAITELIAAGLDRDAAKKAVRLLDLADITVDENGDVDLGDQIDDLKEDFPDLFGTRRAGSAPPVRRTSQDGARKTGKTVDERFADRLLKSAGYR